MIFLEKYTKEWWNIEKISEIAGIHRDTLSNIINWKTNPSLNTRIKIWSALIKIWFITKEKVSVNDLFSEIKEND